MKSSLSTSIFVNSEVEPFIPIACHFNEQTLLTKNQELIQIIEIHGFEENNEDFQKNNLRDLIRETIRNQVKDYNYIISLHVLRNRRNMSPPGTMPYGFPDKLNRLWTTKNNWDKQLVNILYITVVKCGKDIPISNLQSVSLSKLKNTLNNKWEEESRALSKFTDQLVDKLERFGSRKLGIKKDKDGYKSEMLSFYYNLTHLAEQETPLPLRDFSQYLADFKIRYKFNTIEIAGNGFKRYAAVYSVKQAHNLNVEQYDKILQIGGQFIISETLIFSPAAISMKNYHTVIENQEDEFVAKNLNPDLSAISSSNTGRIGDFCQSQVTITIYSDDANFFQDKVNKFLSVISDIGLVVVREDFNMASCFWSQLPGNIKFAVRKRHTATSLACNFTSLHHSNMGCYNGSKWGPAITIFRNLDGNPYYFNFHSNNNGNTIIIGVKGSGKNTIQRFFLTNTTKIKPRIIYLDFEGRSETFIDAIGGLYIKPDPEDFSPIKINLLDSELFANSSEVLQRLLTHAILPFEPKNENYEAFFSALTQKLFFEGPIEDKLGAIKGVIESSDDFKLKEGFNRFLGSATYENFFDEDFLDIFSLEDIISIDLSEISKNKQFIDIYFPALLLKMKTLLDGKPTIICINQANIMFNNLLFKEFAAGFLKELTEKNAIAFLSSDYTEDLIKNDCFKECMDEFATQIYLSNKLADKEFKKTFKLTDQELYKVKSYDVERRMFLLKQGTYSIVGVLNLNGIDDVLTMLA